VASFWDNNNNSGNSDGNNYDINPFTPLGWQMAGVGDHQSFRGGFTQNVGLAYSPMEVMEVADRGPAYIHHYTFTAPDEQGFQYIYELLRNCATHCPHVCHMPCLTAVDILMVYTSGIGNAAALHPEPNINAQGLHVGMHNG